jgi:archaellum component FlaC
MDDIRKLKKEVIDITNQIKDHQNELNRLEITRGILIKRIYELEKEEKNVFSKENNKTTED